MSEADRWDMGIAVGVRVIVAVGEYWTCRILSRD